MTEYANWRDEAACRDADSDLFFPVGTTGPALRQIDVAKRICRDCPVQARCLAWALENGITDGVWGGTTPDERRVIRSLFHKSQFPGKMTRAVFNDGQSAQNIGYVRSLLEQKQPGFAATLELAAHLAGLELGSPEMRRTSALPPGCRPYRGGAVMRGLRKHRPSFPELRPRTRHPRTHSPGPCTFPAGRGTRPGTR